MNVDHESLYEQIGGEAAVDKLIDDFYVRILGDQLLAPFFANTSMEKQRYMQKEFFAAALDGPMTATSYDLAKAHQGRGITSKHLSRFTEHLIKTLEDGGITELHVLDVISRISMYSREVLGEGASEG